jgi:DNA-binding LytR/AlgR family response regulator
VDYLLKPVNIERLERTVSKLKTRLKPASPAEGAVPAAVLQALLAQLATSTPTPTPVASAAPLQWIRASQGDETRLIPIEDVIYFQSNDKYTSVFVADGESLIRTPISKLREQLDEQQFWQIHRSVIVAARHVAGTRQDFRGRLMVQLKGRPEQLVVSRNYVDLFRGM